MNSQRNVRHHKKKDKIKALPPTHVKAKRTINTMKLSFWCTNLLLVIVTASQQQQVFADVELQNGPRVEQGGSSKEELELVGQVEGYLRGNSRNLKHKRKSKSKSKSKSTGGGSGGGKSKDAVDSRVGSGTGTGGGINFDYSGSKPITYECYVGNEWADSEGITCANYNEALCITAAHRTTLTGGIATQSCCICSGGTPGEQITHTSGNNAGNAAGKDIVNDRVGAVIVPGAGGVAGGSGGGGMGGGAGAGGGGDHTNTNTGNNNSGGPNCIPVGELCVKGQTCRRCCNNGLFTNTFVGPELGRCF